jgi:hypothetical protein
MRLLVRCRRDRTIRRHHRVAHGSKTFRLGRWRSRSFLAGAAGRLNDDVRTKHTGDAESIDCTGGVKRPPTKLYAVLCLFPCERVSIKDDVCRGIAAQEVMRLQLGNQHSNIFYREAGLFADFVKGRRPGRSRKNLKNRSPHAVLCWLERLIPFLDEADRRAIAPEDRLSRPRSGDHRPVRAVNAGSYLSRHAALSS